MYMYAYCTVHVMYANTVEMVVHVNNANYTSCECETSCKKCIKYVFTTCMF